MKMLLDINMSEPPVKIDYRDGIMMVGSCFTEHIGDHLHDLKFKVMQNPNGILFDPSSVASAIISYIDSRKYGEDDLFFLNELWQSWQHHSRFSGTDQQEVLQNINASQQQAHQFLKEAKWLIITLGTSFSYRLEGSKPVANCHRAPGNWFNKYMMRTEETITALDTCLYRLFQFNPQLNIIFTVSPVRHIRDGVIENNRSKARLIEAVHHLKDKFDRIYYFPAYELVIDVLRDYRFYDIDLVHPNYQATDYVLGQFMQYYVNEFSVGLSKEIDKIVMARRHKAFQPQTEAHKNFLKANLDKVSFLLQQYPFLDLREEQEYFSNEASRS
jgi:hypothetical protein